MQCELGAWQHSSPSQEGHVLAGYVFPDQLPHCGKIQKRTRIDKGSVRHFGRQSVEVAMNKSLQRDPCGHTPQKFNHPLQLCITQPLNHAVLNQIAKRCGLPSFTQHSLDRINGNHQRGHDGHSPWDCGAKFHPSTAENGAQVKGAELIKTHRSLNLWGDQSATDIGGLNCSMRAV